MCFEAAKYLKLYYNSQPVHLLISSATAPQVSKKIVLKLMNNIIVSFDCGAC